MRQCRHDELLVDCADAALRDAEPHTVSDAEPTPGPTPRPTSPADVTCPAIVAGEYNDALVSWMVQMPFDGDLVVEVYGGIEYNVFSLPIGIELVVDGHIITDGDPSDVMWNDHLKLRVDGLQHGWYELRYFVGHTQPATPSQFGPFRVDIECVSQQPTTTPTAVPTMDPTPEPTDRTTALAASSTTTPTCASRSRPS